MRFASSTIATLLPGIVFHLGLRPLSAGPCANRHRRGRSGSYGFQSRYQPDIQHADGAVARLHADAHVARRSDYGGHHQRRARHTPGGPYRLARTRQAGRPVGARTPKIIANFLTISASIWSPRRSSAVRSFTSRARFLIPPSRRAPPMPDDPNWPTAAAWLSGDACGGSRVPAGRIGRSALPGLHHVRGGRTSRLPPCAVFWLA